MTIQSGLTSHRFSTVVRSFLLVTLLGLWSASAAMGQVTGGVIQGIVTDPQGSALPGVEIVVTNTETNLQNTTRRNQAGLY